MKQTVVDPFVLYRRSRDGIDGIVMMQVDDTNSLGNQRFMEDEENSSAAFISKDRTSIKDNYIVFNGQTMVKRVEKIEMTQDDKIDYLRYPSNQKDFNSVRALAHYVGACFRPDLCSTVKPLSLGNESTSEDEMKHMRKIVDKLKTT